MKVNPFPGHDGRTYFSRIDEDEEKREGKFNASRQVTYFESGIKIIVVQIIEVKINWKHFKNLL